MDLIGLSSFVIAIAGIRRSHRPDMHTQSCIVGAIPLMFVRNCGGGPQDILEVGDSYLSTFGRTQRSNFPEKVTSSYLSLEFGATAGKCLIRDRDGQALPNPTSVIEVRGLEDDPG